MPAPKDNTNARKGDQNRQPFNIRLPVEVIEIIKLESARLGMSQADYVAMAVRELPTTGLVKG